MFNKQFQMFRQAKEKVSKAVATRFWGNDPVPDKFLLFNRMFGSMFPGRSPKGPAHDLRPSGGLIKYRQRRKKLNKIAFESRQKNWRK